MAVLKFLKGGIWRALFDIATKIDNLHISGTEFTVESFKFSLGERPFLKYPFGNSINN